MRRALLVPLVLVLAFAACGGDDDAPSQEETTTELSDDATIEYHYGDSSVPPEYHRSYTLTVTKGGVHAVVDSYGDVLHDVTEPLPPEVWRELVRTADDVVDLPVDEDEEPCTGGTTRDLTIEDGGKTLVDVSFGACGGSNSEAETRVDRWIRPVTRAIPNWESYLETD